MLAGSGERLWEHLAWVVRRSFPERSSALLSRGQPGAERKRLDSRPGVEWGERAPCLLPAEPLQEAAVPTWGDSAWGKGTSLGCRRAHLDSRGWLLGQLPGLEEALNARHCHGHWPESGAANKMNAPFLTSSASEEQGGQSAALTWRQPSVLLLSQAGSASSTTSLRGVISSQLDPGGRAGTGGGMPLPRVSFVFSSTLETTP